MILLLSNNQHNKNIIASQGDPDFMEVVFNSQNNLLISEIKCDQIWKNLLNTKSIISQKTKILLTLCLVFSSMTSVNLLFFGLSEVHALPSTVAGRTKWPLLAACFFVFFLSLCLSSDPDTFLPKGVVPGFLKFL